MAFYKELKILKKIKALNMVNNGGFPVIISAKLSKTYGEILMSSVGIDIFEYYGIAESLNNRKKHVCFD